MTADKEPLYDYGLTSLKSFLDSSIHKPSSLKRTINRKELSSFYVVILSMRTEEATGGALRTGLSLKGQNLLYRVKTEWSKNSFKTNDKEIHVGSINLKNLMLKK